MRPFLLILGVTAGSLVSCAPASFPDQPAVAAAQNAWCQGLAKVTGAGASWDQLGACTAMVPSASAAYLGAMTKCLVKRREELGNKTYDLGQIAAECNDEVTLKLPVDDRAGAEVIEARCERALRCEKVPVATCKESVAKLEVSQRALLYGTYNASTVHAIAQCVRSSSCDTDEDAARAACYKGPTDKLRFMP